MELLKKITGWFKSKFEKLIDLFRAQSGVAVAVTAKLKKLVEDTAPIIDIVTDLIPGDLDDKIHNKLLVVIPQVAEKVAIAHGILQAGDKDSDVVAAIINHLKDNYTGIRTSFWIIFAGELNVALSDNKLTLSEGVSLTQIVYDEIQKNK